MEKATACRATVFFVYSLCHSCPLALQQKCPASLCGFCRCIAELCRRRGGRQGHGSGGWCCKAPVGNVLLRLWLEGGARGRGRGRRVPPCARLPAVAQDAVAALSEEERITEKRDALSRAQRKRPRRAQSRRKSDALWVIVEAARPRAVGKVAALYSCEKKGDENVMKSTNKVGWRMTRLSRARRTRCCCGRGSSLGVDGGRRRSRLRKGRV